MIFIRKYIGLIAGGTNKANTLTTWARGMTAMVVANLLHHRVANLGWVLIRLGRCYFLKMALGPSTTVTGSKLSM
jgi:hypothetical protein